MCKTCRRRQTVYRIAWLLMLSTALRPAVMFAQQSSEFNISIADKTEETGLLEKGQWQIESGFLYNGYEQGIASEIGQLFIRHSVGKVIEFRLLVEDGKGRDRYITQTVQSTYPLAAGTKIKLLEKRSFLPDMTLVGYIHIPLTGHNKMQSAHWSPMLFMAFQHKVGERWSVDYNAGAQQEAFGTSWSAILNGSVHYKITDDIEVFTEYFAQYEPLNLPEHNAGVGSTFALNNFLALYLAAGSSLGAEESNYFVTGGAAIRFH